MKKIKIAQIGTSRNGHGNLIWNSMLRQSRVFEIAGYAFPENEKEKFPENMKAFEGYRELSVEEILNDPDIEAVIIETEEIYLTKYALLAAKAGKHIHMEKPGGQSLPDFEELIETVQKSGKTFHTGYMYRYNPCIVDLLKRIENGEFGEIKSVEAQMNQASGTVKREWLGALRGGNMFFLGCHMVDLVYRIMGKPEKVTLFNSSTENDGAEDFAMAVFGYNGIPSFVKANASEKASFERRQLVVCGTEATAELKPLETIKDANGNQTTTLTVYTPEKVTTKESELYNRYDTMMLDFAEAVALGKPNNYSLDYELGLYRLLAECCGMNTEK